MPKSPSVSDDICDRFRGKDLDSMQSVRSGNT